MNKAVEAERSLMKANLTESRLQSFTAHGVGLCSILTVKHYLKILTNYTTNYL